MIVGDPVRLHQVIWNLLSNAVKFTQPSGTITVEVARERAGVMLRVTDTGCGMDAAFLGVVFSRFTQANSAPTRSESGLGIGLAIVKHLVEAHGGTVRAQSPGIGQGSTFEVFLPLPTIAPVAPPDTLTSFEPPESF